MKMHFSPLLVLGAISGLATVNANYCYGEYKSTDYWWRVDVAGDDKYNTVCGNGCLDNLRGRCGVITSWGCNRNPDGGAHYEFFTDIGCTSYDVTQAILACTNNEQNIPCSVDQVVARRDWEA